jgi:hypothetical protein
MEEQIALRGGAFVFGIQYRLVAPKANNGVLATIFQFFCEDQAIMLSTKVGNNGFVISGCIEARSRLIARGSQLCCTR